MPGPGWQAGPSHPTAAAGVTAVTAARQSRGQGGPGLSRGWSDTRAAPAASARRLLGHIAMESVHRGVPEVDCQR